MTITRVGAHICVCACRQVIHVNGGKWNPCDDDFLKYIFSDREFCIVYFIDSSRSNSIVLFSLRNVVWILNEKRAQNCEGNLVVQLYEI